MTDKELIEEAEGAAKAEFALAHPEVNFCRRPCVHMEKLARSHGHSKLL